MQYSRAEWLLIALIFAVSVAANLPAELQLVGQVPPIALQILLLVLLTPIIWAVNNIITKDIVKRHSPIVMIAASFVLSSLFLAPVLSPNYMQTVLHMGLSMWLALIYCILSTIFGFSIWYWSLRHLPPSTVAVSMYLIPVISVAAGRVFLNEPMPLMKAAGIAIVLLGLYLVNVRFK